MKKIFKFFILLDLIVATPFLFYDIVWFINSQVAFFSSLFVTYASFYSYKKVVDFRVLNSDKKEYNDRDELDKIDDKHELFDNEEEVQSEEDLQKVIKQERKKTIGIKQSFLNFKKTSSGAFSLVRISSYIVLFVGFLALLRHDAFLAIPYFAGLSIVPFATLLSAVFRKGFDG